MMIPSMDSGSDLPVDPRRWRERINKTDREGPDAARKKRVDDARRGPPAPLVSVTSGGDRGRPRRERGF
jgi:hypothetical protein